MRFSVIVPSYNAADVLQATVDSALAQSYSDLEVVISDDGSVDDTLAVARRLAEKDERVRVVTAENGGCACARNRAIEVASGEFCVLLDAEDVLDPGYLEAMAAFVGAHPGFDIYSCNGTRVLVDGSAEPFLVGREYADETSWTLDDLIPVDRIFIVATLRRELWERLGGFRSELRYAEDYDFWLRALASGARQVYTPQRLATYVESAGGKSKNRIPHARTQIRIFEDLSAMPGLTDSQRRLCAEKIAALRTRIERVELEARLQRGEYGGARATYLRVRSAYISAPKYVAGLALMMLSPRLYASVFTSREARRVGSA